MSKFNKSYRIRTEVGKDTQVHVNLERDYDILEVMSLSIDQKNAYKFHTSNYGVIAGRVLANEAFGIPNAKVSVFIKMADKDATDSVKTVLYPYNTTQSKNIDGVKYNLLPDEQLNNCYTIIGTFPEKQYMLDNDNILEVFEDYYKFTTRTNNAGDYMIFGIPTGSQTIHVDIDLSDIGILSQKPRDMFYKGYNVESFENANKFKYDTNIESLVQVISQDMTTEVIPFWGEESETSIGITRCDIQIQYKFEPTCVFMGSVVSDTNSNGISKKCIPTSGMGSMEEIVTGSGTIEMIRKTPSGGVEEYQIKGNQLINGNGVWCYQIPMNLDYMMTDEFGNMVPTNHPEKGIPTRTRVRFRLSLDTFENDDENMARGKMLIPHNPNVYCEPKDSLEDIDYQFGTYTKESSYRDLFWNGVYSVKSYIPRLQKGSNWKDEKFTGFKRVNYYGDNNPIPYNNIRIKIPFMFTVMCILIKSFINLCSFINKCFRLVGASFIGVKPDEDSIGTRSGSFITLSGELCNNNLDWLCIVPGLNINKVIDTHKKSGLNYMDQNLIDKNGKKIEWRDTEKQSKKKRNKTMLATALLNHYSSMGGDTSALDTNSYDDVDFKTMDTKSIDYNNNPNLGGGIDKNTYEEEKVTVENENSGGKKSKTYLRVKWAGIKVTNDVDYLIKCIEMNLANEYKVIQFDFYNDWINGLIYLPRWMRTVTKKRTFIFKDFTIGGKIKACNESGAKKINLVQQCALTYYNKDNSSQPLMMVKNEVGCKKNKNDKLECHKSGEVRKSYRIFRETGLVHQVETMQKNYVYYFKPIDYNSKKTVRLFATDIILLGTLNSCDRWGIPSDFRGLSPSTYQMPTNLALTDSELEGENYEAKLKGNTTYTDNKGTVRHSNTIEAYIQLSNFTAHELYLRDAYTTINPIEEDANYTELSGISWNYEGPLQKAQAEDTSQLYQPGGHFLGLTCRNSSTTIKSCINLSRICEHGVWMSQRKELNIPNKDATDRNKAFLNYATVPSGLISKDEISDNNYRRLFATMNHNKLQTVVNPETDYCNYEFKYLNPTNFSGELNKHLTNSYNRYVGYIENEKRYTYTDYDTYERIKDKDSQNNINEVNEYEIMRTGEFLDIEYLKYRLGLNDDDIIKNKSNLWVIREDAAYTRFINYEKDTNNEMSFPIYNNSFYFYFGLKNGNTAVDEFKRLYYANCDKTNLFTQSQEKTITLLGETIIYDGFDIDNDNNMGYGSIQIDNIVASDSLLVGDGTKIQLFKIEGDKEEPCREECNLSDRITNNGIVFLNLKAGEYRLKITNKDYNISIEKEYTVGRVSLAIDAVGYKFNSDVSSESEVTKFTSQYVDDYDELEDRNMYGGFIIFKNNEFIYTKSNNDAEKIDISSTYHIDRIEIECYSSLDTPNQLNLTMVYTPDDSCGKLETIIHNEKYEVIPEQRVDTGEWILPVPKENASYVVKVYGFINKDNKLGRDLGIQKSNTYAVNMELPEIIRPLPDLDDRPSIEGGGSSGGTNDNIFDNDDIIDGGFIKSALIAISEPIVINNGTSVELYYNNVSFTANIEGSLTEKEKEYDIQNSQGEERDTLMNLTNGWWNHYRTENNKTPIWEDPNEEEVVKWRIKEALYMNHVNDKTKPHVVRLDLLNGTPPYTIVLEGVNNNLELLKPSNDNMHELHEITLPTLNYYVENKNRRGNFIFFAQDENYFCATPCEHYGFTIPVIYKPFFTEILLCKYEHVDNFVYLNGNVYNGKTWYNTNNTNYEFNVGSFNNQEFTHYISTDKPDTKFEFNEFIDGNKVELTGICDNWEESDLKKYGKYCKYNGRKIPIIYRFNDNNMTNTGFIKGDLKIGTNKNDKDGNIFNDETTIINNSLALCTFKESMIEDGGKIIKIKKEINKNTDMFTLYLVDDKEYPYPWEEDSPSQLDNSKLFRDIMNNTINTYSKTLDDNGYIVINDDTSDKLYYIAIPTIYNVSDEDKSNVNNVLKSVSFSSLINIKDLNKAD